ncbi:MAG TPA: universal stress protein [Frankiaceae bacterium]|nr:universal stress protein [Frankiaceae bacterium]
MSETSAQVGSNEGKTIVVGIDGSPSSIDALRWAGTQAEVTGAGLRVVSAWSWPAISGYAPPPPEMDLEKDARVVASSAVRQAFGESSKIPVDVVVAEGSPAAVLLKQAREADLLVVGSRGHGAFAGMLLGSVSSHCVSHAACPVVVVRGEPRHQS